MPKINTTQAIILFNIKTVVWHDGGDMGQGHQLMSGIPAQDQAIRVYLGDYPRQLHPIIKKYGYLGQQAFVQV